MIDYMMYIIKIKLIKRKLNMILMVLEKNMLNLIYYFLCN